uniref:Macro domain-containing protein n=1 Tax=Pundamilia nyererei TaxID=303518 RepID=A0A3B4HD78_9CICH
MATCPTMRWILAMSKNTLVSVGQSYKCLIQLEEQNHVSRQNSGVTKYNLCDGLQVLVCQGDITTQWADALVNAANEDLEHGGGVAAALSKAGGPQVQIECRDMVKKTGKIPTGDVVLTTGGNLKCKKLLHAVGPVNGKCGGKERMLLEKTVSSALNLAEMKKFTSIAMPCISSGLFCVPLTVCAEAIATAVKEFGSQGGRSLSKIILIDKKVEVVKAMRDACDRILRGTSTELQPNASGPNTAGQATAGSTGCCVQVEIVQGTLENQQVKY